MNKELNAAEAVYGFVGWLTSREERTVMSAKDDCAPIAELIKRFCTENNLPEVSDQWPLNLIHPSGEVAVPNAVLAKWGTPATAGAEPVALLVRKNSWRDGQWEVAPPNSPSYGLAWADQRMYVYTTPQPTQPVAREPLTDEAVDLLCKVGPVYVLDGKVTRTPAQYRDELKAAQRYGLRKGERAHGIKGGSRGTE